MGGTVQHKADIDIVVQNPVYDIVGMQNIHVEWDVGIFFYERTEFWEDRRLPDGFRSRDWQTGRESAGYIEGFFWFQIQIADALCIVSSTEVLLRTKRVLLSSASIDLIRAVTADCDTNMISAVRLKFFVLANHKNVFNVSVSIYSSRHFVILIKFLIHTER